MTSCPLSFVVRLLYPLITDKPFIILSNLSELVKSLMKDTRTVQVRDYQRPQILKIFILYGLKRETFLSQNHLYTGLFVLPHYRTSCKMFFPQYLTMSLRLPGELSQTTPNYQTSLYSRTYFTVDQLSTPMKPFTVFSYLQILLSLTSLRTPRSSSQTDVVSNMSHLPGHCDRPP